LKQLNDAILVLENKQGKNVEKPGKKEQEKLFLDTLAKRIRIETVCVDGDYEAFKAFKAAGNQGLA